MKPSTLGLIFKEAKASDEIVLAYLVELDGVETTDETTVDPGSFPPKR